MKQEKPNKIQFAMGILLAFTAAYFMLMGILPLPVRIIVLIIGLALIATSKFRLM